MGELRFDYSGSTLAITGAAGGIAKGIAMEFAKAGACVAVGDMKEADGLKTVEEIKALGGKAVFVKTDVSRQESADAFINATVDTFGGLDILINGAGVSNRNIGDPLTGLQSEDFDFTYGVNVKGMFHTCKAVYNMFRNRQSGRIINVASVVAHSTNLFNVPYAASKAAAVNFTMNLAKELGPFQVTVNAICPGYIYTPMYESAAPAIIAKMPAMAGKNGMELVSAFAQMNCATKKVQTEQDIAYAALFLASNQAVNITGVSLDVAGGYKL